VSFICLVHSITSSAVNRSFGGMVKPDHAGSAAITPSDFLEVIVSPQQWEVANITGRRWNFGGLRR
jgi:hypothetical protein